MAVGLSGHSVGSAQGSEVLIGVVVDSLTGTPIAGALVRMAQQDAYTVSVADGRFVVRNLRSGYHLITFSRLGYEDAIRYVRVPADGPIEVRLTPRPVELEALTATSDKLHKDALRMAHNIGGFFKTFDRNDVIESGVLTALDFLAVGARIPLRPCEKSHPERGTCTIAPFLHPLDLGRGGKVYNASGLANQALGSRGGGGQRGVAGIRRTSSMPVFLNDEYLQGGLDALARLGVGDVERVETYGARGEAMIRVYTSGYLEELATGRQRPNFALPRLEYFQPSIWDDSIGGR